jgi:hypothetical protein
VNHGFCPAVTVRFAGCAVIVGATSIEIVAVMEFALP